LFGIVCRFSLFGSARASKQGLTKALCIREILADNYKAQEISSAKDSNTIWLNTNLHKIFDNEIIPVSETAQQRVPIPGELNLATWLVPLDTKEFEFLISERLGAGNQTAHDQFYAEDTEEQSPLHSSDLSDVPIQTLTLEEPVQIERENSGLKPRLNSVLNRPIAKNYSLLMNHEGDDLQPPVTSIQEKTKDTASSIKKKKRKKNKDKVPLFYLEQSVGE
jgi:hypothetical protein